MKLVVVFLIICLICLVYDADARHRRRRPGRGRHGLMHRRKRLFNRRKMAIYRRNLARARARVSRQNALYKRRKAWYRMRLNKYSHLTSEEFKKMRTGALVEAPPPKPETYTRATRKPAPSTVDWETGGLTTSVKDQKECGCCYTMAAAGTLEGQLLKKYNRNVSLSNQQIIDCSTSFGNLGCDGGYMTRTFKYIMKKGGLNDYNSYGYVGQEQTCKYNPKKILAPITSYKRYVNMKTGDLKHLLATVGPLAVKMHVVDETLRDYNGGIYFEDKCLPSKRGPLDHSVLLVGYGVKKGVPYWKVKNSWGAEWGDHGYFYIPQKQDCGITGDVIYPIIA